MTQPIKEKIVYNLFDEEKISLSEGSTLLDMTESQFIRSVTQWGYSVNRIPNDQLTHIYAKEDKLKEEETPHLNKCKFSLAYRGSCDRPSIGDFCDNHLKVKCVCCGEQADQECDQTLGPLICGDFLCSNCEHEPNSWTNHQKKIKDEI